MTVRIYTANMGGRDRPWPQVEQTVPVDWVYFTDDPEFTAPAPWATVYRAPDESLHRNLRAKWFKTHPFGVSHDWDDADYAIWIDASMQITSPNFAEEAIAALDGKTIAAWRHPRRDCIYEECEAALTYESVDDRYATQPLREQVEHYRTVDEYPEHGGLWACGTIVWTRPALPLGEEWYRECLAWSMQDQLSFPVAARRTGIEVATFPVEQIERHLRERDGDRYRHVLGNRWLRIHEHRPGTDR